MLDPVPNAKFSSKGWKAAITCRVHAVEHHSATCVARESVIANCSEGTGVFTVF